VASVAGAMRRKADTDGNLQDCPTESFIR